jgi:GAF domain-containing protein
VDGHDKQEVIRSCCGVPLVDGRGNMFGSVCHYDFAPHAPNDSDVHLLEDVAPLLLEASQAGEALR